MIAITNRRSYYFHLKSTEDQFMASVGFEYPEIEARRWHEYEQAVHAKKKLKPDSARNARQKRRRRQK